MKPDWIENAGHLAELDVGDVLIAPDGGEWSLVDVFREPRFGFLVTATAERGGNQTIVDAEEFEWIGYGGSATNRWRWRPTDRGYPAGDARSSTMNGDVPMAADERRARWQIARARSSVARSNAVRNRTSVAEAIDELDHYLATNPYAARWSGPMTVFLDARLPAEGR